MYVSTYIHVFYIDEVMMYVELYNGVKYLLKSTD